MIERWSKALLWLVTTSLLLKFSPIPLKISFHMKKVTSHCPKVSKQKYSFSRYAPKIRAEIYKALEPFDSQTESVLQEQ